MGIVGNRLSADAYDDEFTIAKAAGIDAFALNMGPDVTNTQLGYAYDSAAKVGIKVFISFDFNDGLFNINNPAAVGERIKAFKAHPAQLIVDNKPFVSTFIGIGLNVASVESAAGTEITFFPNWYPHNDQTGADGLFNWMGWYNNGENKPGLVPPSVGDEAYLNAVGSKNRYMAPVAPWFFAHYGGWVPYTKNWIFQGNDLWFERWQNILTTGPRFIEIVAWNDYGESSYVGPLRAQHVDDGHSGWVNDMPHGGWLEMAKPFIAAYKSGATSPQITEEKLVYWYRPMPKGVEGCSDPLGKPDGWDLMTDEVFVVSLLKTAGTVTITSGSNTNSFDAPAGASLHKIPMGVGTQRFALTRGNTEVMSETSQRDIINTCPCGLYNFNAYVGTVPAGREDILVDNGNIKKGGGTCEPKSSLPIRAANSVSIESPNSHGDTDDALAPVSPVVSSGGSSIR